MVCLTVENEYHKRFDKLSRSNFIHKPEGIHVSQFLLFAFCPCIKRERKHIIRCKVETSSREEFELRSPCGIKQLNKSLI